VLPSSKRAKNARSISLPSLWQNYLVAIATFLDKLENKEHNHHWHIKRFHTVERLRKSVQYIWRYSTKYEILQTTTWIRNAISIWLFSAETTGPIFTKILHDIVALVILFNHAYTLSDSVSECQSDQST